MNNRIFLAITISLFSITLVSAQLHEGKYKGRMYVAANHSSGNPKWEVKMDEDI